ncbi:alpha/beta hydrolase [Altererythrobacter aquiaggeris]|uniref:alpha/beta hydrolase n=1 Tax=Aestuarierythrobacter aquiaggeris TaxID=1898396 RepID=UPI003019543B
MITQHILTIPSTGRRVHYRRCGSGPALLLVHQSPRSSAEYAELMERWGEPFTCIAPDTPGFGQSAPLPGEPEIDDFADALAEFLEVLGVGRCAAYGFHSGGIILVTALKRHPDLFSCLAIGGYAIWTSEEIALFGDSYLPPFRPSDYGEHLTWLWNRMLEQSWFFPWFDIRKESRLSVAHADIARVHQAVMEMLDAGDAYRAGYGAVLRAPRDIAPAEAETPPVLITAYDGDPLQAHLERLGDMPQGWQAYPVATPAEHQDASFAFLLGKAGDADCPALAEDEEEGWLEIDGKLIHWRGKRGGTLTLHPPGCDMEAAADGTLAIDVPGHGLSDRFEDIAIAIERARKMLGATQIEWPSLPAGDPGLLYPDLTPDRFGTHLLRAWSAARAEAFFDPWYEASARSAVPLDRQRVETTNIAQRAHARLRAGDEARRYHLYLEDRKDHSE